MDSIATLESCLAAVYGRRSSPWLSATADPIVFLNRQTKKFLGMHFIQPPQHIVVKLVQLRQANAISGRWLSQVHTQKKI